MAIDWNQYRIDLKDSVNNAAKKTDEKLASKISSITRMTDEEIIKLFPKQSDAKKLAELMEIIHSADKRNIKINKIVSNAENFGGVVLTLLSKFS